MSLGFETKPSFLSPPFFARMYIMYLYNTHVFRGSVVTFVSHCYCTYADPATALGSNNKNKNKEKIKMTKKKKNKKQSVTVD